MHNAAFAALGLDWVYVPFPVPAVELRAATRGIRALGIVGVNVTVPHKEAMVSLVDECSPLARRVGAVNTVVAENGRLIGENTDVWGVRAALREAGVRLAGKKAIVIGAGGSARAVLAALEAARVREVVLINRTRARALALARRFRSEQWTITVHEPSALETPETLAGAAAVINATSLGLRGESFFPMRAEQTPDSCLFFDLIYGHKTDFLEQARAAGRSTLDGLPMLLHQGAKAFALWTGRRAPLEAMRQALAAHSDRR